MDFGLEIVLTQPCLASRANQKAKWVGRYNTRTSQQVTHPSTTLTQLRSSDGIRCISAGLISPISILTQKAYKPHAPTCTLPNSHGIRHSHVSPCRTEKITHRRPSELTQHSDRELVRYAHKKLRKNNFPGQAHAKMGYLGVRTMDFELENLLTQPSLAGHADQKAKQVGGVQHEDFPGGHPS
jgi:hypothetical protein